MSKSFASSFCIFTFLSLLTPALSSVEGVHVERKAGSLRATTDAIAFQQEVKNAMAEALGCGGHVDESELQSLEQVLLPMYRTLPKNSNGRLERRSLRHLAHRYFSQRFSLVVRGFEPSRPVTDEKWGSAEILSQRVPGYVESVLESRHAQDLGFDLRDAALLVATLEQLIFDSESSLLDKVYKEQKKQGHQRLSEKGLGQVLEAYLVHWLMGEDEEGIKILLSNRTLLETSFPHWDQLVSFANGQVKALDYAQQKKPTTLSRGSNSAFSKQYTFDDAHAVVGGITKSFASFWESECTEMKTQLVAMDPHRTGRVPLSKFYGTGLEEDWRFGESEAYLRELGALDETGWRGKQVIIPNYIQAASNCIVTSAHYMVCCGNDCDSIIAEIESSIGAPTASVEELISLVSNMTSMTSLADEVSVTLDSTLRSQLASIAEAHNGRVPIHGRLFMQWIHYVFPRECPFPHKSGTVASVSPLEFGNYVASKEEMKAYSVDNSSDIPASMAKEDLQWMSQWSEEEELLSAYEGLGSHSWSQTTILFGSFAAVLAFGARRSTSQSRKTVDGFLLPTYGKAHLV